MHAYQLSPLNFYHEIKHSGKMTGVSGHGGYNTSPNSSEELDSNQATPATKVSVFSPHDIREALKPSNIGIVRSKVPPAFVLTQPQPTFTQNIQTPNGTSCATQDPFVSGPSLSATTQSSTDTSRLSPTASTFTPPSTLTSSSGSSLALSEPSDNVTFHAQQFKDIHSKLLSLVAPPGLPIPPGVLNSPVYRPSNKLEDTSVSSASRDTQSEHRVEFSMFKDTTNGSFSTDNGISRCLMVSQVATDCPVAAIEGFFSVSVHKCLMYTSKLMFHQPGAFGSVKNVVCTDLVVASTVYVRFGDMRDVFKAANIIENSPWGWSVEFIDPEVFAVKVHSGSAQPSPASKYEAQVLVTVKPFKSQQAFKVEKRLGELVRKALGRSGDLMALEEFDSAEPKDIVYRAEFCSVDAVDRLLINSAWLEIDVSIKSSSDTCS